MRQLKRRHQTQKSRFCSQYDEIRLKTIQFLVAQSICEEPLLPPQFSVLFITEEQLLSMNSLPRLPLRENESKKGLRRHFRFEGWLQKSICFEASRDSLSDFESPPKMYFEWEIGQISGILLLRKNFETRIK